MSHDGYLQIGEVAERADLSLRSVRFYEEQGLVTPAKRSDGGFRLYTEEQVERLLLIKQMKPLGFAVQEMLDVLTARDNALTGNTHAKQTLAAFADDARTRCTKLRAAVENGEAFASRLDADARQ